MRLVKRMKLAQTRLSEKISVRVVMIDRGHLTAKTDFGSSWLQSMIYDLVVKVDRTLMILHSLDGIDQVQVE